MAGNEDLRHLRYAGRFVDFQAEAVARAVEEALHAAVLRARLVAPAFEQPFHFSMDIASVHPGLDPGERDFLSFQHRIVQPPERVGHRPLRHGAGDVRVVPGLRGLGKQVEDYGLAGAQRSGTAVVGVAALDTPGDDRVLGDAVPFQQVDVDALPEVFGSQRPLRPVEQAALHGSFGQYAESHAQGVFRVAGGVRDGRDLVVGLHRALVPEGIHLRRHHESPIPKLVGVTQGKAVRYADVLHIPFP